VALDVARFDLGIPLSGIGLVGDDADGASIRADAAGHGIDTSGLLTTADACTSYTDVMTERDGGRRTFFHMRGANALFAPEHVDVARLECRIFSLGYLLLLDAMDAPDAEHGTRAASLLQACRTDGMKTAIDVVSEDSDRFSAVITPALRHTDYAIINEIEAGRTTGRRIRGEGGELDRGELDAAAADLFQRGVHELVVLHAPEGAIARTPDGSVTWSPSLSLPAGFIKGSAGAGDAFFAGMLAGLHEAWPLERTLEFAHGAAAASLRHPTCTGGVESAREINALLTRLRTERSGASAS
ncbi:MAG: carbohydrate kinase family protein, partial [Planctomycetota bacterium]